MSFLLPSAAMDDKLRVLQDMFPGVDHRIIRATLRQDSDLDKAIEFILQEVLTSQPDPGDDSSSVEASAGNENEDGIGGKAFYDCSQDLELEEQKNLSAEQLSESSQHGQLDLSTSSASLELIDCDIIEQMVEETKADKEMLAHLIEEVNSLKQGAAEAEAAAQESKLLAARLPQEIEDKAAKIRESLHKAKEAHAMHAGEVYGEKAMLCTETRELCARLESIRAGNKKTIAMVEEIKSTLRSRITAALEEAETSDREREVKEAEARQTLEREEAAMAKLAQESRDLESQANDFAKLRELIVTRGSEVDALQGEMTMLKQEVESLKQKIEEMSSSGFVNLRMEDSYAAEDQEVYKSSVFDSPEFFKLLDSKDSRDIEELTNSLMSSMRSSNSAASANDEVGNDEAASVKSGDSWHVV